MLDNFPANEVLNTSKIGLAVRNLYTAKVAVTVLDPRLDQGELMPVETSAIVRASPGRVREFTAGRIAARLSMIAMGLPVLPVLSGDDRAPIWPTSVTGSISHSANCCVVVTAAASDVAMLGVDVEPLEALDADLFDTICTSAEIHWLAEQYPDQRGQLAKLIFSAKECVYKCQYPLSHQIIGFSAIQIVPDLDENSFTATFTENVAPFQAGDQLFGRFAISDGLILTGMTAGG